MARIRDVFPFGKTQIVTYGSYRIFPAAAAPAAAAAAVPGALPKLVPLLAAVQSSELTSDTRE